MTPHYSRRHPGKHLESAALSSRGRPQPWAPAASVPLCRSVLRPVPMPKFFPRASANALPQSGATSGPCLMSHRLSPSIPLWPTGPQTQTVCSAHCQGNTHTLAKGTSDNGIATKAQPAAGKAHGGTPGLGQERVERSAASSSAQVTPGRARPPENSRLCCLWTMSEPPYLTPMGFSGLQINRGSQRPPPEVPAAASRPRHSLGLLHVSYSVR